MVLITKNEVNTVFDEQVRICDDTLKRKAKEYTGDDTDRLEAFKAAAALQHTTPERALAGMLAKHIVSLYDIRSKFEQKNGVNQKSKNGRING